MTKNEPTGIEVENSETEPQSIELGSDRMTSRSIRSPVPSWDLAIPIITLGVMFCAISYSLSLLFAPAAKHGELVFKPATVIPGGMPAITNIPLMNVSDIDDDFIELSPDSLVLGVTVNGKSRAYPLNQLMGPDREIFNDMLDGRAIMPTW